MSFRWFNIGRGQPLGRTNVDLKLVTFVVSGTSTGGVGTTTAFLDFPSEAKCRAAADVLAGADRINASRGNHPNISPSRDHKDVICSGSPCQRLASGIRRLLPPNNGDCR